MKYSALIIFWIFFIYFNLILRLFYWLLTPSCNLELLPQPKSIHIIPLWSSSLPQQGFKPLTILYLIHVRGNHFLVFISLLFFDQPNIPVLFHVACVNQQPMVRYNFRSNY